MPIRLACYLCEGLCLLNLIEFLSELWSNRMGESVSAFIDIENKIDKIDSTGLDIVQLITCGWRCFIYYSIFLLTSMTRRIESTRMQILSHDVTAFYEQKRTSIFFFILHSFFPFWIGLWYHKVGNSVFRIEIYLRKCCRYCYFLFASIRCGSEYQ